MSLNCYKRKKLSLYFCRHRIRNYFNHPSQACMLTFCRFLDWPFGCGCHQHCLGLSLGGSDGKESACNAGDLGQSLGWENPWRREWLPTPVFLPDELHGQRSLAGYSPQGGKKLDMTELLTLLLSLPLQVSAASSAKSPQLCLTLCDPIEGSPPGSSVPGILQARTLEWVAISFSNACMHAKLLQSCLTLCDPMDSSPPGFSVHRILQARILEWVAISFSPQVSSHF